MANTRDKDRQREYNRQYYLDNRRKILARHRAWNEANKEYMRLYYEAHKESISERRKQKRRGQKA